MIDTKALNQQVTQVTEDYFGPAASRFVDRLIINHLGKEPSQLDAGDMPELIEWMRLTASILTENNATVEELAGRLETLTH